jgi:hypothetical protein
MIICVNYYRNSLKCYDFHTLFQGVNNIRNGDKCITISLHSWINLHSMMIADKFAEKVAGATPAADLIAPG